MKTILMLAAAMAVGMVMASSAASAATTGINGCYLMLPNQVILTCEKAGPSAAGERFGATNSSATQNQPAAPLYTGSIRTSSAAPAQGQMQMVDSEQKCRPGAYWILHNPNDDIPMACPSS